MSGRTFSLGRFAAVFTKEFVQMRRDRITFGMMIGVPLMQLVLFGYAINSDPKHLPAALVMGENSSFARSIVAAIENTDYFRFRDAPVTEREAYIQRFAQTWKLLRVGSFPQDEALDRDRAIRTFERGLNPAGVSRQLRAILASGSRKERLKAVKAPTLVIHGNVDPLVRPEGGKDTAASIPGAKLVMIDGMGHALPIPLWPQIIGAIVNHARGTKATLR